MSGQETAGFQPMWNLTTQANINHPSMLTGEPMVNVSIHPGPEMIYAYVMMTVLSTLALTKPGWNTKVQSFI
jgi:hypothetical protein